MRRTSLAIALMGVAALAACGDNRPAGPAETSPAVSDPAPVAPQPAAPEAVATPEQAAAPAAGLQGGTDDWRRVASTADAALLARIDDAWKSARAEAKAAGFSDDLDKQGALVDPDAAQAGRLQPPPGAYRCRTVKLGSRSPQTPLAYVDYPWFACRVELTPGGDLVLTKTTGSQRTRGLLYPDTDNRLVYVGVQAWGDERGFLDYGANIDRDQVGALERIGANRWRLVVPWPKQESKLELLEIIR